MRPVLKVWPGAGRQAGTTALSWQLREEEEEEEEFFTRMIAMSLTARLISSRADRNSRGWSPRKAGCKSTLGEMTDHSS